MGKNIEIGKRLLHRVARCCEILLLQARTGLLLIEILRVVDILRQIAKVAHIWVEVGTSREIEAHTYRHEQENQRQQRTVAVEGIGIDAVNDLECMAIDTILLWVEELRQIKQRESCGADYRKRCEQAKVLKQLGVDEDQTHERTDGGETAQEDRLDLIAEHAFWVAYIFIMCDDMEHITQCHTQHDGADSKCQKRELSLDEIHHRQAKHCAECHRQKQQRNGVVVAETEEDEDQHHDERTHYGVAQVGLGLP